MLNRFNDDRVAERMRVHRSGFAQVLWNVKGAISLALMVIILPACNTNEPEALVPAAPAGNVTTEEVADKTNALIGQTVTVRSEPVKKVHL
jgi:hypothetical protein